MMSGGPESAFAPDLLLQAGIPDLHGKRDMYRRSLATLVMGLCFSGTHHLSGDVIDVADHGFRIRITRPIDKPADAVFAALTGSIGQWWSRDHTWSGDAANMALDLQRGALIEKLADGGFVRHLEIVFYQPGSLLRLAGGLGPLQGMGLNGALTFSTMEGDGKTQLELTYNVSGFAPEGFEKLAPVVDQVLSAQVERLKRFCETGTADIPENDGLQDGAKLVNEIVELSCGECQFGLEGEGCDLAIRYRGHSLFVEGSDIDDHGDAHAEDGLCTCVRRARVSGKVVNDRFHADRIEVIDQEAKGKSGDRGSLRPGTKNDSDGR
jgi:uncharacterized protein YndB with AHSA1/START domain